MFCSAQSPEQLVDISHVGKADTLPEGSTLACKYLDWDSYNLLKRLLFNNIDIFKNTCRNWFANG